MDLQSHPDAQAPVHPTHPLPSNSYEALRGEREPQLLSAARPPCLQQHAGPHLPGQG